MAKWRGTLAICTHQDWLEDRSRDERLRRLMAGDIIYGEDEKGIPLIWLVESTDDDRIFAHRMTTQESFVLDRKTGAIVASDSRYSGFITSIEPLPEDKRNTLLGYDRRLRLAEIRPDMAKLTEAEKDTLLFLQEYYARFPL